MSDSQILTIVLASVPTMITVLIGILINNSRLSDLRASMDRGFQSVDQRFNTVDRRFNDVDRRFDQVQAEMNRRFDDTRDMWRSELHRVEEILDARLKHIEERR